MAIRIAVMGAGGIGGYFGGRLAAAGEDVSFIARGAHLQAMQANGLQIVSPFGDALVRPVKAGDDPAAIGPVDIVMFCVKLYDTETAAAACKPLIGPDTAVISFLNGIDSEDRLRPIVGADHIVGGVAQIPSIIREPGVIEHKDRFAALQFGEMDGRRSPRLEAFLAACRRAGVAAELVDDIEAAIWAKFIMLASFAAVCCLTRQPARLLKSDPDIADLYRRAVAEISALAASKGVRLPADIAARTFAARDMFGDAVKPSMLGDLERGRRIELDGLSGAVVRLGRELGIDTPVHRVAYAALKPYIDGTPA